MANQEIAERQQPPKDAGTAQASAKMQQEVHQPGAPFTRAQGAQVPAEFPQITIVETQENGVAKPLFQIGVADNVRNSQKQTTDGTAAQTARDGKTPGADAAEKKTADPGDQIVQRQSLNGDAANLVPPPTVPAELHGRTSAQAHAIEAAPGVQQPSPGELDTPLRRFCNTPIPLIPLPDGLPQCEQEIKNGQNLATTELGAQVGVVKAVYDVGNGAIVLLDAGLSPAARLGNFLANAVVNPKLAMHDAVSWGNDSGKALVGATKACQAFANYGLAVSKAEWQGDFLKEPRDGVFVTIDAAKRFGKQSPGQQAEGISEQSLAFMVPMAADKVVELVPQLAKSAGGGNFLGGSGGLELCPAGGTPEPFFANGAEQAGGDGVLKMTGRSAGADFAQSISSLRQRLLELDGKPLNPENLKSLEEINRDLIDQEQTPITDRRQAKALEAGLRDVDNILQRRALAVIKEVKALKPRADELAVKVKLTDSEDEFLDRYTKVENTAYQLVKDRLKEVYGWDEKSSGMTDISYSDKDGHVTQSRVNNAMSDLLDDGLDKNPVVKEIFKATGIPLERARDWVGIPMPEGSAADKAGCDYLLVNRITGEMYTFDVTEKVVTLRHGRFADSLLTDKNLAFMTSEKNIPVERKSTVIGAAKEKDIQDMIYRLKYKEGLSSAEADKRVELAQQNQLAEVIAKTISQPSPLNIFETRLPSADPFTDPSVQIYELQKFQADLTKLGYDQWAARLGAAIGWTRHS